MPGNKQRSKYHQKRKRTFTGVRKQEIQNGGNLSTSTDTVPVQFLIS